MTEFLIPLTPEQLAVLEEGLGEVPLKRSAPVVAHINAHIRKQQEQAHAPTSKGEPK